MTTEKLAVQLAVVCRAQALRLERQQAELKIVRERNRQLRSRVVRLSRSRDQWRDRATGYRHTVNRLRSKAAYWRLSSEVWKVRASGKARAAEGEATAALVRVPPERYASDQTMNASSPYHS